MANSLPHVVAEQPGYSRWVEEEGFDRAAQLNFILEVAQNPQGGVVVAGTGGVRKIRAALPGEGKSGGVRLFFVYLGQDYPVVLLTGVAKKHKANLSNDERNQLYAMVQTLKGQYPPKRRNIGRVIMGSALFERMKESLDAAIRNPPGIVHLPTTVARRRLHMTQAAFAQALGVSLATVQAWEQGRRRPGTLAWRAIRELLDHAPE